MKPLRLKMQAFGSYGKETVIDFEKVNQNLFLITGDTGAGKTTIFDAIVFALYGEASSSTNKKDGVVLQSQYVDFAQEPFVELVFAEGQGETREVYTVRRVPRHLKMITRGAAKGKQREVTGSVSLIMPDGTEYPSKETDRKLQEITGLAKGQFMQVAMIAQGEFMELLRARSDDKKVIFRKLFNTEMYQEIVAELGNRKRAKEKEIAVLKTQCQSEVSRIRIPEIYGSEILKQLKKQLEEGEMTRLTDFLKELEILCDWLGKHTREAEKEYQEAAKKRDEKREAYTRAEELLKWFVQLEDAEQKLQQYASDEGRIKEMQGLLGRIRDTWEIRENYMLLSDAQKHLRDLEEALLSQEKRLPMLKNAREAAESAEEQANQTYDQELQNHSRISEKVQKSLEVLTQIKNLSIQTETDRKSYNEATRKTQKTQQQQETLEQKAEQWKIQSEELAEVDKKLAVAEGKKEEADAVSQEISDVRTLGNQAEQCRKKAIKAREDYVRITEDYNAANTKYESMRQRFLNAQAGFLAEELEPGKPCPVCGSTEHPNPHKRAVEYVDISEEKLQNMQINVDKLRKKQEKSAGDVAAARAEYETRKTTYIGSVRKLQERLGKSISSITEQSSVTEMDHVLENWKQQLKEELNKLKKDAKLLAKLREALQNIEEQRRKLRETYTQCMTEEKEAAEKLAGSEATLKNLKDSAEFQTEEEAKAALQQAVSSKQRAEETYQKASAEAKKAVNSQKQAETLIGRYQQEIPTQRQCVEERKTSYIEIMRTKQMTEKEWKELAEAYSREAAEEFQKTVNTYYEKKAAQQARRDSAKNAVGEAGRPVLEEIQKEKDLAETEYLEAEKIYNQLRMDSKDDGEIFAALSSRLEERKAVVEEHTRIDALYRMTSGNVSGARMDLETYVQRYYLERILYAANRRFQEMSAGQFELRMYDLEKAGEGKNRGLDLMVYSTVTGKEREVRTLSGGESFMAALSLALGMADQIQESSAAVNLDMMFIDEGFGSLDEHSRNQAVKVLQEMAEGSRLIGIISHVTELKQEIEDQLIVNKDENGSRVRWQIS